MRKARVSSEWRISVLSSPMLLAALISVGTSGIAAAQTAPAAAAAAGSADAAATGAPANGVGSAFELAFWQSLNGSEDPAAYEAYIAQYPGGTFSGLARARVAALLRSLTAQPVTVAAPAAEPVPAVATGHSLAPTAAVVIAATPTVAPVPAAATPQSAEMIPANASLAAAEMSSPLAKLLAQLRGTPEATAAAAATAPLVTAAPPVQPASAAVPALTVTPAQVQMAAAAPAPQPQAYAPTPALVPAAAPVPAAATYASSRPVMLPVPDVAMPAYFCSNDARNAFHNTAYRPAVEAATRNNEAAVGYLRQLQQTYDRGQLGRDTAVLNAIAVEARAYQGEAARAYSAQAALVRQFDVLMAVPLRTCAVGTQ
ncbi:MAG: hypothetical protein ACKVOL_04560 [Novosphingobium sp.]